MKIQSHPGRLPEFWDRNVLFFVNLRSLFFGNLGQTEELDREVKGIQTYGGRLIPVLNLIYRGAGENLLMLEAEPDPNLVEYYTGEVNLRVPAYEVLPREEFLDLGRRSQSGAPPDDPRVRRLRAHGARWVDGFVMDDPLFAIAQAVDKRPLCSPEGSRRGNNKLLLHRFLEQAGLPVFDSLVADTATGVPGCIRQLRARGYSKFVVKAQIGASGIGMLRLEGDTADAAEIPEYLFFEGPALVQGWLDDSLPGVRTLGSPSVQLFLHDDHLALYDITEQLLSPLSIHQGNLAPPRFLSFDDDLAAEMLRQAGQAGAWLHEQGYRGTASADFLVVERAGHCEVYICEINARVTGATYPAVLARHLRPGAAWLMRNLRLYHALPAHVIFDALREHNMLFRPGAERGILPINFNHDDEGNVHKAQFLYLGPTIEACLEQLAENEDLLPAELTYDRD